MSYLSYPEEVSGATKGSVEAFCMSSVTERWAPAGLANLGLGLKRSTCLKYLSGQRSATRNVGAKAGG